MTILPVGDGDVPSEQFGRVFGDHYYDQDVRYLQLVPTTVADPRDLPGVLESQGDPRGIIGCSLSAEVLVVHAAPVTATVLDTHATLHLECCAQGGPINVDVAAATTRGIPVITTPGKNAATVPDTGPQLIVARRPVFDSFDHTGAYASLLLTALACAPEYTTAPSASRGWI